MLVPCFSLSVAVPPALPGFVLHSSMNQPPFLLTVLGRLGGPGTSGGSSVQLVLSPQVPGPPVMMGTPNSDNGCCPVLQGKKDHVLFLLSTHDGNGTLRVWCGFSAVPSELTSFLSHLLLKRSEGSPAPRSLQQTKSWRWSQPGHKPDVWRSISQVLQSIIWDSALVFSCPDRSWAAETDLIQLRQA